MTNATTGTLDFEIAATEGLSMTVDTRVVIVGAGFGGLNAAKALAGLDQVRVTLVDRRNYHLFQPLLYQVATAGLSPADIAMPVRSLFSKVPNIEVRLGNVTQLDLNSNHIMIDDRPLGYDYLILSCGAKHSYFSHPKWERYSPGLKTLEQATEIRRRILLAYEEAEKQADLKLQKDYLTFVVVGGGPTGVELAGAIGEISRYTLERDFRHIDPKSTRVVLVEAGPRILNSFTERLARRATRDLNDLGVEVRTQTRVTQVTPEGVRMTDEFLPARTVLWAAGVQPSSLNRQLPGEKDSQGRVIAQPDLRLPHFPSVFVIGDQAHVKDRLGNPLPGLAPVAMQEGRHAARNIRRLMAGLPTSPFHYVDKGQMATVGRKRAVFEYGPVRFGGFWAWVAWLFIHIFYLIGFKNRLLVLIQWAWSYMTFKRGARLILDKEWMSNPKANHAQNDT